MNSQDIEPQATADADASTPLLPYVTAPPPITLPAVPAAIFTQPSAVLRGHLPRKQELALVPDADEDLGRFADFAEVFGKTVPSRAEVEQTVRVAYRWSILRAQLGAWDAYARAQEVAAWVKARDVLGRLAAAFNLAAKTDRALGFKYPSLGKLFAVRSMIAKRGAAVRTQNAAETEAGLPAFKGAAGKRRMARAARAALAAEEAAKAAATARATREATPEATPEQGGSTTA
jgi:hypothetical protein